MYQHSLIKFGGTYLTDDGLSTGNPYINEIEGLGALKFPLISTPVVALDGTVFEQFTDRKGAEISITFSILDVAMWDTLCGIVQTSRTNGTTIAVQITNDMGSFYVDTRCTGVDFDSVSQEAGVRSPQFNLIVTQIHNTLSFTSGRYEQTGRAVTLTYSGA
jgi:hypothetical protein